MTHRQKGAVVIGLFALSFFPIWRCAGGWRGINLWEYIDVAMFRGLEAIPHVPIEEAIENARKAYCEVMGLDYEQSFDSVYISRRADTHISGWIG